MLCIYNICCKTWNNIKVDLMYPNVFVNKKRYTPLMLKTDEFNAIMRPRQSTINFGQLDYYMVFVFKVEGLCKYSTDEYLMTTNLLAYPDNAILL